MEKYWTGTWLYDNDLYCPQNCFSPISISCDRRNAPSYHTYRSTIIRLLSNTNGDEPVITSSDKLVNPDFPVVTTVWQSDMRHHASNHWTRQFGHGEVTWENQLAFGTRRGVQWEMQPCKMDKSVFNMAQQKVLAFPSMRWLRVLLPLDWGRKDPLPLLRFC